MTTYPEIVRGGDTGEMAWKALFALLVCTTAVQGACGGWGRPDLRNGWGRWLRCVLALRLTLSDVQLAAYAVRDVQVQSPPRKGLETLKNERSLNVNYYPVSKNDTVLDLMSYTLALALSNKAKSLMMKRTSPPDVFIPVELGRCKWLYTCKDRR